MAELTNHATLNLSDESQQSMQPAHKQAPHHLLQPFQLEELSDKQMSEGIEQFRQQLENHPELDSIGGPLIHLQSSLPEVS